MKFFEKHDLFKFVMIALFVAILFSWIMPYTYYDGTAFVSTQGITRVGFLDATSYGLYAVEVFGSLLLALLVIAGFYKFLGSIPAYQVMTDKIAKVFKGKEKVLAVVSIVIYTILTSVAHSYINPQGAFNFYSYLGVITLLPLSMTVFSKLKVDKVTGVASTVGGILIGVLCSTCSSFISGIILANFTTLKYGFEILPIIILALIAIGLLSFFVAKRIDNTDKNNLLVDLFAPKEVKTTKASCVGMAITLAITFIVIILAFIGWESVLNVTVFSEFLTKVQEAEVFGFPLFGALMSTTNAVAFGAWNGYVLSGFLVFVTIVLQLIYRVPVDSVLDSYLAGFKKVAKTVVLVLFIYVVLYISVVHATVPYIVSGIAKLGDNVFTWFLTSVVTSIFGVDIQYAIQLGALPMTAANAEVAALAIQTGYGFVQFFAPTSIMLITGLSLMDVKLKDYFKFAWKFILALLVIILILLAVVAYV